MNNYLKIYLMGLLPNSSLLCLAEALAQAGYEIYHFLDKFFIRQLAERQENSCLAKALAEAGLENLAKNVKLQ